jgi:hypothetical protein
MRVTFVGFRSQRHAGIYQAQLVALIVKVRFGGPPKPTGEPPVLPGTCGDRPLP